MRKYLLLILLMGICRNCNPTTGTSEFSDHPGEFQVYANGLIYSPETMWHLGKIVDSLNIRFRTCDLSHSYHALTQGEGTIASISSASARRAIHDGISLHACSVKYPVSMGGKAHIIKSRYMDTDWKGFKENVIEYSALPYGYSEGRTVVVSDKPQNDKQFGWVVNKDSTEALYLNGLIAPELPYTYSRLVQYVDCMIDTTAEIYFPRDKEEYFQLKNTKTFAFVQWIESYPGEPQMPGEADERADYESDYEKYVKEYREWNRQRLQYVDKKLKNSEFHQNSLKDAVAEALKNGATSATLEYYTARFGLKREALTLMRRRKVRGACSMDQAPRRHAMDICRLAAETNQWDIFLRSHLDIMNDRFDRNSDGCWAWRARQTYIKELEELDINVADLLLGTCLVVQDVDEKHYWGSTVRIGRALAEASNHADVERRLLEAMSDEKLDVYNRLMMAYVYCSYSNNIEDVVGRQAALDTLEKTIRIMPRPIQVIWEKNMKPK